MSSRVVLVELWIIMDLEWPLNFDLMVEIKIFYYLKIILL